MVSPVTHRATAFASVRLDVVSRFIHTVAHGEIDPALAVDFHNLYFDQVTLADNVFDFLDPFPGELADVDQAFLARQEFDEGAKVHQAGDAAFKDLAWLGIIGNALDDRNGFVSSFAVGRRNKDAAVILDVNLDAGFLDDAVDDLAPEPMTSRILSTGIMI